MRCRLLAAAAAIIACAGCSGAGASEPPTVTVLAAASLTEAFTALAEEFEMATGVEVALSFAGSQVLAAQLAEGAPGDVFASADAVQMGRARRAGLVEPPVTLATNALTIITPAHDPAGIEVAEDLAREGVKVVLAGPEVPAGRYAHEALDHLGLLEAVEARIVSVESDVKGVVSKVAQGEADAGIVYVTDARGAVADLLRTVPLQADIKVAYLIARTTASAQPDLSQRFIDFSVGDGAAVLRGAGLGPP